MKKIKKTIKEFSLECIRKEIKTKVKPVEVEDIEEEEVAIKKPKKSYEKSISLSDLPKPDYSFMTMDTQTYIDYMLHRDKPKKEES